MCYTCINIIVSKGMGSSSPRHSASLTRNWRHVSPSLIRNQLTHELISQNLLSFATADDQQLTNQQLAQRIRLQHSNIVKLIYYTPDTSLCSCSPNDRPYRSRVYTEYPGDNLRQFGRAHPLPLTGGCPCVGLLNGVYYLQQCYGPFEVGEDRVFLDLQPLQPREGSVRVWVHQDCGQSHPERSCSEQEMVMSLISLFSFMKANGFCRVWNADDLVRLSRIRKFTELREQVLKIHGESQEGRHKKSYSAFERKTKEETPIAQVEQKFFKPSSLPHCNQLQKSQELRSQAGPFGKIQFVHSMHQPMQQSVQQSTTQQIQSVRYQRREMVGVQMVASKWQPTKKGKQTVTSTQDTLNFQGNPSHISLDHIGVSLNPSKKIHFNYQTNTINRNIVEKHVPQNNNKGQQYNFNGREQHQLIDLKGQPQQIHYTDVPQFINIGNENLIKQIKEQPQIINAKVQQMHINGRDRTIQNKIRNRIAFTQPNQHNLSTQSKPRQITLNEPRKSPPPHPIKPPLLPNNINSSPLLQSNHNSFFPANQVTVTTSLNQSPILPPPIASCDSDIGFTMREMQLPLREQQEGKDTSARLPTTSRSPKKRDILEMQPITEVAELSSQIVGFKNGKGVSSSLGSRNRNPTNLVNTRNPSNLTNNSNKASSKNQKIQRYAKEIKQYEENIRQRLSSSTGNRKIRGLPQIKVKPEARSQRQGEFKETKSLYNDSELRPQDGMQEDWEEGDMIQEKNRNQHNQRLVDQAGEKQRRQRQDKQKEIEEQERRLQIQRLREAAAQQKRRMQRELQRLAREREAESLTQEQTQQAHRQREEKIELHKDLQSERKFIQSEMSDLLRQNAMKEEYRSIRQKVKQKKQTFAQLKAEAAKILEDCLY